MRSPSRPPDSTASAPPASRARLSALLVIGILLVVSVSLWRTQQRPRPIPALRLDDRVTLKPPPPLPTFSASDFRRQWQQRQTARASLKDEAAVRQFARAAAQSGDPMSAYLALQDYLRTQPQPSPPVLDVLGRVQNQLGLAPDAERSYREVVRRAPEVIRGYLGLSRALMIQERREEAAQTLEQGWTALPQNDIKGRLDLVEEWEQRGELPRALQGVETLDSQAPNVPEVLVAQARLLFKLHRLPEAKEKLEPLVAAQPDNGPARTLLAGILVSPLFPNRDLAAAETALLEAIKRNPADLVSLSRLGQFYQEQGRLKQSAYIYTQMLEHAPDSPDARLQLARAYALLGSPTMTAEQNRIAQKLLKQRLEESRLTVRRDQKPRDAAARLALARYYIEIGRYDKALPELQAASVLMPPNSPTLLEIRKLSDRMGIPFLNGGTER